MNEIDSPRIRAMRRAALRHDIMWGMQNALFLALICLGAAVFRALMSSSLQELGRFAAAIALAYGGAVLLGGVSMGLLRQRLDGWHWRCVVGVLAMIPIAITSVLLASPDVTLGDLVAPALTIAVTGGVFFALAMSVAMYLEDRWNGSKS